MINHARTATVLSGGKALRLKALALACLLTLPISGIAQTPDISEVCHEEVSSIDVRDSGWSDIEEGRLNFRHVFQYKEEYPYFEYVGGAMLGVSSNNWYPHSIIPNFSYWLTLPGRTGGPEDNHYSIVDSLYGRGNTHGISLVYSSDDEFAFLLFDHDSDDIRESVDQGARIGKAFNDGAWGVLTYVNGEVQLLSQDRSSINLSCGSSNGYMLFDNPKLAFSGGSLATTHCAAYANFGSEFGNEYLRSILLLSESVQIASQVHTQRKLCRRARMPLAATNSDALRPVLQEQLSAWATRVHASVVAYRTAEEEAQAEQQRTRWVKVLEFPQRSRGNFHQPGENDVRIEFPYTEESGITNTVYSRGHLLINGVDLGEIVFTTVGHVGGLFGRNRKREEVRLKFEAGDFPTSTWKNFTDTRYTHDDNRYYECNGRVCSVFVRANKLTELGWKF